MRAECIPTVREEETVVPGTEGMVDGIEARIVEAEQELKRLTDSMHDPQVTSDGARLHETYDAMQKAQAQVDELYARWAELESKLS